MRKREYRDEIIKNQQDMIVCLQSLVNLADMAESIEKIRDHLVSLIEVLEQLIEALPTKPDDSGESYTPARGVTTTGSIPG